MLENYETGIIIIERSIWVDIKWPWTNIWWKENKGGYWAQDNCIWDIIIYISDDGN